MSVMDTDADTDRSSRQAVALPIALPTDYPAWLQLRPRITQELLHLASAGSLPAGAALKRVCRKLFGVDCSAEDETRFLLFAAPIARKIAIGLANRNDRVGDSEVKVQDLVEWLARPLRPDVRRHDRPALLRRPHHQADRRGATPCAGGGHPRLALRQGLAADQADLIPTGCGARAWGRGFGVPGLGPAPRRSWPPFLRPCFNRRPP